MIEEGSEFPDFSLPLDDGSVLSKRDLSGYRFVVFAYPKDLTAG
ncbi:MAG TPA: hypothetical protein VNI20_03905 [Fimbriimonadaceae bacterium]|nr:hypothetical protein [Fimbriimonadaceae bacterium]